MKSFTRLTLAAAVVLVPLSLGGLNATGLCISQLRYVPGDEFLQNAIFYRAKYMRGMSQDPGMEDISRYLKNNPKCCRLESSSEFFSNSFFSYIFGYNKRWVHIIHPLADKLRNDNEGQFSDVYISLDNCGTATGQIGQLYSRGPSEIN